MLHLRSALCASFITALLLLTHLRGQSTQALSEAKKTVAIATGTSISAGIHIDDGHMTAAPSNTSNASNPSKADSFQPSSIFDAVTNSIKPVTTSIEVHSIQEELQTSSPEPLQAGGEDVLSTAGTYGDISRYLQVFPGVVPSSDLSNQILVRGGHPMENLFFVDGIEVPNINHLTNANTTGGFGPMIDAAVIQGLKVYTGGYDAKFPERLSSVTEFRTLDSQTFKGHVELDFGIQGFGGLAQKRVHGGDLLVSAHHGLINLVSSNVGINGVPSYTNELIRYRKSDPSGDRFSLLNVAGWDSIEITPCASDQAETSTIESKYRGWRETTGAEWQRVFSQRSFGIMSVSDSEQMEHIQQEDQIVNPLRVTILYAACPLPDREVQKIPVYKEASNNAFSTAKYRYEWANPRMALTAGTSVWLQRPHIQVEQPVGAFTPYSDVATRADSSSFNSYFSTGESGTYTQLLVHAMKSLSLSAGGRMQTFALGSHTTFTTRLSANYQLGEVSGMHVAYATYAQLPPYSYLLAYQQNRSLRPMRVTHAIIGMDVKFIRSSDIRLEAYNKEYSDIPASTEYPAVTLHTIVDMIGEQSVWLPMNSSGHGNSSGIELSDMTRLGSRFQMLATVAYSRAKFAGTDGIRRPSNFDFPWIINVAGGQQLGHGMLASGRYGFATGRPFTPFNLSQSVAQNRPVYDLTKVNGPRSPYYGRLDAQINKELLIRGLHLELYAGVDNILNRSNLLSYAWMPRYELRNPKRNPVGMLWQTPIFPNFGVRLIVK